MYLYIMSKRKKRRFYLFHFLEIIKTMCPPGYHHNGFVATDALGHMMYEYTLLVPMNQIVLSKLSKEHNVSDHT